MQESEPYVMTKKRTVRRIYWGRIVTAVMIASFLVIGSVLWFSRSAGKLTVEETQFYYVAMGEFAEYSDAQAYAQTMVASGGAGYVLDGDVYSVAVACYAEQADAYTVSNRLTADGKAARVVATHCPSVSVKKPKDNADALKDALTRPKTLFDEIYAISLKADTKQISVAAAQFALLKMSVACEGYAQDGAKLGTEAGTYLQKVFTDLSAILDKAAQSGENILQAVKYAQCAAADTICKQTAEFVKN